MTAVFAEATGDAIPIHVIEAGKLEDWLGGQPDTVRGWVKANGFTGKLGQVLILPDGVGFAAALAGWGSEKDRARGWFHFGTVAAALPEGTYRIESGLEGDALSEAALAFLLSAYRFSRYKDAGVQRATLVCPDGIDPRRLEVIAAGVALTSDLINTPASDMGPDQLENAFCDLAGAFGAKAEVIRGRALLAENFPMVHAVGRASDQPPRLLDMTWGDSTAPKVTLVGKGVCFDTGGLNIKPGSSMGLMKKDMGGAATVLGLARMIMALNVPVRLRVIVPAVENSISAGAFRPGDILTSRKGLTVEINNTDAEGRLVLADALALADEESPAMIVCMATLTGAARVALGPDLPPFFTDDGSLAGELEAAASAVKDPLWRMPFWDGYETMIEPGIADLDNAPSGGFAGAITAALFLRRFVENAGTFAHFDCYGWTPAAKPARPKGGACQGARALLEVIEGRYGNGE
ncbi:leucyl aminopeptidase family protein [Algicella marina]|uniref:Leucyl aminopeptidase family protein n=1 Tax=Algicella marina TaxID=2683284 RepID=A0A6P1T3Y5_9RHOB|nr:leucyl aminopeptidase family protein [Algicella marina]QHQ36717.1 leucyl aminopeptidase family protein [Algicella marina]